MALYVAVGMLREPAPSVHARWEEYNDRLLDAVRLQPELASYFEALHRAWLARDTAGILAIGEKHKPADDRLYREVMDRLLDQRNRRMAERLAPVLKQGKAFIAVGAAHLPGEAGLLYLLEKAGYRVTAVY